MEADYVNKLFNDVLQMISQNIRKMMEELWLNWSHLGVDKETKTNNIYKLVEFEKELHIDVVYETRQRLKLLQEQIDKLKEETEELSKCLSVDITMLEFKEEVMLVDYKKELEEQISGYREQVQQRRMKMERLLEWQRDLVLKLGVSLQELDDVPLPSEEELDRLRAHLEVLQAERDKRAEVFLNTQVDIKDIMDKLQVRPQSKFEHVVTTALSVDFPVTDMNMDSLAKLRQELQERYEQTNNRVLELRERLAKLWECLEEDQIYRDNFVQAHHGCHPRTEAAIREEIRRCEAIKRQKIQVFVANVRTKIKLMWDAVHYSAREREQFVHYYQDTFTEDTLTLHELYLDKITKFYNDHKQIFEQVETRKNLWLKMCELEARANEPGRFHNRGGQLLREEKERKAIDSKVISSTRESLWLKTCELEPRGSEPGRFHNRDWQLLREEKRKAIDSKLPKIEEQLRELVTAYEAESGHTFTVDGKPLLQMMADEWEARKAERNKKVSARRQLLTPTQNTPLLRSLATSPLGKRTRAAAGLQAHTPATADTHRAKRPLVTGSAPRAAVTLSSANLSAYKRSAVSTVKRRQSGRLVARGAGGMEGRGEAAKRKLNYGGDAKKPKATVNGSILKHKRLSGRRRSSSRRSVSGTLSPGSRDDEPQAHAQDPLQESTLLTTYTDFKDRINEKQISRSSLATAKEQPAVHLHIETILETNTPTPTKTTPKNPKINPRKLQAPLTPKIGKENLQTGKMITPKPNNLLYTPNRLTRSAMKLDEAGFATPRAPLSATKGNINRQNAGTYLAANTPPLSIARSKSQSNIVRAKNLPPFI